MFRKILFWSHLTCGVIAGIGILTMSVTGVLLTYEQQIKDLVARTAHVPESQQIERLSLEQLFVRAVELNPDSAAGSIVIDVDHGAPVIFRAGRRGGMQLNPYSGEQMQPAAPWLDELFSDITGFHRWFNFSAEDRAIPRTIIGISNLFFLFLIVSGLYLWLPRIMNWRILRTRLFLRGSLKTTRARDFVWHHVFGIWSSVPLIVLVVTGSMFSFRWTGDLIYAAFGAERPVGGAAVIESVEPMPAGVSEAALDDLFVTAAGYHPEWEEISIALPENSQSFVNVTVDRGNGRRPQLRGTLVLDRVSGAITEVRTFDSLPLNQRIRSTNRFLHTGEYLGIAGQTIAGLVSAFAAIMVWTGIALAWRRLVWPLIRRPGLWTPELGIEEELAQR